MWHKGHAIQPASPVSLICMSNRSNLAKCPNIPGNWKGLAVQKVEITTGITKVISNTSWMKRQQVGYYFATAGRCAKCCLCACVFTVYLRGLSNLNMCRAVALILDDLDSPVPHQCLKGSRRGEAKEGNRANAPLTESAQAELLQSATGCNAEPCHTTPIQKKNSTPWSTDERKRALSNC